MNTVEMRERLAAERAELVADIERREQQVIEESDELARQDRENKIIKKEAPTFYKVAQPMEDTSPPPFDEDLLSSIADVIGDLTAPLENRVSKLETQVEMLVALLGNNKASK
jgi:hypothetical protein